MMPLKSKRTPILKHMSNLPVYEQGATLIVVLLVLILIMLAGAMAVRQSRTDLQVATSDQINTALLQSSDSANQKLEIALNNPASKADYAKLVGYSGVFGYFLVGGDNNRGDEFIYCYNPNNQTYLINKSIVRKAGGGTQGGGSYCDYTKADSYTSSRQTTMTQMSVTTSPITPDTERFSHMTLGKDTSDRTSLKYQFDLRATSALPSYNEPKLGNEKCFEKSSIPPITTTTTTTSTSSTVIDCLKKSGTPSKMLFEQADVENISSATRCIPFGKGSGSLESDCVLKAASTPSTGSGAGTGSTD